MTRRLCCASALSTCVTMSMLHAAEPPYPARPLRIVTGFPPGGNTDIIARAMAQKLTERLGQQVIVENRPGAGSMIGTDYVAKGDRGRRSRFRALCAWMRPGSGMRAPT
jgi:tripartite-type tricarboxylate transporter receptor subunit TctC